jgi:hypothetical protein
MMTNVSAAACKHPTEKLMRSGVWGVEPPKSLDWVIKSEVTPDFSREFPIKNPNLVDLQKWDTPVSFV